MSKKGTKVARKVRWLPTIIPKKRALLQEMGRVVGNKRVFAIEDLAALVEQGAWGAEYALQGRGMELGLNAYVKMIAPGGGENPTGV